MLEIITNNNSSAIEMELQKMKTDFEALAIASVSDREGYKAVQEAAKAVRARRLEVQKQVKEIEQRIAQIKKDFSGNVGLIIQGFSDLETSLRLKMDAIDAEKARIKEAERLAELKRFNERTQALFDAGFTFNGSFYSVGLIMITTDAIKDLNDDAFATVIENGIRAKEAIDAKAAEQARMLEEMERHRKAQQIDIVRIDDEEVEHIPEDEDAFWAGRPLESVIGFGPTQGQLTDLPFDADHAFIQANPFTPPPAQTHHVGYTMGFDAARNKILQILDSPEKMTREQLRERIQNLGY